MTTKEYYDILNNHPDLLYQWAELRLTMTKEETEALLASVQRCPDCWMRPGIHAINTDVREFYVSCNNVKCQSGIVETRWYLSAREAVDAWNSGEIRRR